ncbi:HPr family phosphocarrier protein [Caproiciproducens galactitolivorans]|uniref:Phosphocarrier protein HPr n=1 Tax=Caproiciproducens galactitolivorans TaxID=642589 RepID=A0A4Z0XVY5_9FIRM|nr:HPr family phosphocarrier protein [Caproiciproducens galactitolivorans]QEY34871.1 HPr family phosphocarrier protein [Caproiciproducens galactitolivorans]TGJ75579.1 phosphocarrier protein HPr [Caproiciproducens galactitolivorans]
MRQFDYVIKDPEGLHARPAGLLVQCAKECTSKISISTSQASADAKKLFKVMGLGVASGEKFTVTVEGKDEAVDSDKIRAFLEANL